MLSCQTMQYTRPCPRHKDLGWTGGGDFIFLYSEDVLCHIKGAVTLHSSLHFLLPDKLQEAAFLLPSFLWSWVSNPEPHVYEANTLLLNCTHMPFSPSSATLFLA